MTVDPFPHRKHSLRRIVWLSIVAVIVVAIAFVGVFANGIYHGNWRGGRTQSILKVVPLPVGLVDWHTLSFRQYLEHRSALEQSNAYLEANTSSVFRSNPDQDAVSTALTKMIRSQVSEELMRRYGVTVTDAEVEQAIQSQVIQQSDRQVVANSIRQLYRWSIEQFGWYVIRPSLITAKLQEKLSFDDTLNTSARQQAESVFAKVQAGEGTFQELAKKYSDDTYGATGGDLGFVKPGDQLAEIDDAIAALDINQYSPLIHTKYGFHIVKLLERKTIDGVEQQHILQITILTPQVDIFLNQELKKHRIRVLLSGYHWDNQTLRVVKDGVAATTTNTTANQ